MIFNIADFSSERLNDSFTSNLSDKSQSILTDIYETGVNPQSKRLQINRRIKFIENGVYKITLYEIGTGNSVGEMENMAPVSSLKFSSDASYLMVGTYNGICLLFFKYIC